MQMKSERQQEVYKCFINGVWEVAENGAMFDVINPASGEVIARVTKAGSAEAKRASEAAAKAFYEWSRTPARERANLLWKLYEKIMENIDEIASIITLEAGKPLHQAKLEVLNGAEYVRWNAEEARRIYGKTVDASSPSKRLKINKEPVGPVAAITPWNFPFGMVTRKVSPAIAAGCTVVLKPAEETPLTAIKFFELAEECGFPNGVINLVMGDAPAIGDVWLNDKNIKMITFTGSTKVGKMLYEKAAKQMKRVSLELGGHAPAIVFDDCDLKATVQQISRGKLNNSGQTCICPNRIYVQESIADQFIEMYKQVLESATVGDGSKDGTDVGPLINLEGVNKADSHVKDAVKKGAKLLVGGKRLQTEDMKKGFFYAPTLLTNVNESMDITHMETFGPVTPILTFKNDDEVIERANATDYGLAAYIFTTNLTRSHRVAEELEFGMIGINDTVLSQVEGAFGGVNESGIGREGGPDSLEGFLEDKFISTVI